MFCSTKKRCKVMCLLAGVCLLSVVLLVCTAVVSYTRAGAAESVELAPIAHYEFANADNLGEDSTGNFNLTTYGNSLTRGSDSNMSWLNFAEGGALYAPDTYDTGKDLSDYLVDYTISFQLKKEVAPGEWNPVLATGNGIGVGLTVYAANGNIDAKHCGTDILSPAGEITAEAWSTVTLTFDKSEGLFQCYIDGVLKATDSSLADFNLGAADFALCIGANYNQYTQALDGNAATSGAVSDVKIYDCFFDQTNVTALLNGDTPMSDPSVGVVKTVSARANYKVRSHLSDAEILGMSDLLHITATDSRGETHAGLKSVTASLTREDSGAVLSGLLLDGSISGAIGKIFVCEIGFYTEADNAALKPVAHYEFEQADNLGRDSMGNFDLQTVGSGLTGGSDDKGNFLNFSGGGGSACGRFGRLFGFFRLSVRLHNLFRTEKNCCGRIRLGADICHRQRLCQRLRRRRDHRVRG